MHAKNIIRIDNHYLSKKRSDSREHFSNKIFRKRSLLIYKTNARIINPSPSHDIPLNDIQHELT